jgi:predicted Rossmann fold nucleotide-binding protein DprA/Smf involved in DNA uptake
MLLLSTFDHKSRRMTEERSLGRNRFAAALADEIMIVHAEPGGHADLLRAEAAHWGKHMKTTG